MRHTRDLVNGADSLRRAGAEPGLEPDPGVAAPPSLAPVLAGAGGMASPPGQLRDHREICRQRESPAAPVLAADAVHELARPDGSQIHGQTARRGHRRPAAARCRGRLRPVRARRRGDPVRGYQPALRLFRPMVHRQLHPHRSRDRDDRMAAQQIEPRDRPVPDLRPERGRDLAAEGEVRRPPEIPADRWRGVSPAPPRAGNDGGDPDLRRSRIRGSARSRPVARGARERAGDGASAPLRDRARTGQRDTGKHRPDHDLPAGAQPRRRDSRGGASALDRRSGLRDDPERHDRPAPEDRAQGLYLARREHRLSLSPRPGCGRDPELEAVELDQHRVRPALPVARPGAERASDRRDRPAGRIRFCGTPIW